ncbi:MAG: elongation factor P [Chloroflexia bacterium]
MARISVDQFKRGMTVIFNDQPHQLTEVEFVNPGKGSSFYRTTLKSLKTGRVVDFTFKSNESLEDYEVYTHEMQYLYNDGSDYHFMRQDTMDQHAVPNAVLGKAADFLVEGDVYQIVMHGEEALGIKPPKRVVLTVTTAEPVVKGSTVSGVNKSVELENGVSVSVPGFIKEGDKIAVNPENGEYIERV